MQKVARISDRTDSLVQAFAAAEYLVDADGEPIMIRIGDATPALDRHLDGRPWAVITAHNPDGRRCADDVNAEAHRALKTCLHELRPAVFMKVCNRDPAGQWPDEPGWLFTPESITQADALARRFGQRAIVIGSAGRPAELRMYGTWQGPVPEFMHVVGP